MSDAEYEWRMKLKPVNLVIETDFSPEQIHEVQARYGSAARALIRRDFGACPELRGIWVTIHGGL
jgi:hypothetical protein